MTVECYVDAKPRAQIKWFKSDVQLDEDDRVQIETYPDGKCRLRILNFMKEDEGLFKCVATNDLGTATTYANLTVESKTRFRIDDLSISNVYPLLQLSEKRNVSRKRNTLHSSPGTCRIEKWLTERRLPLSAKWMVLQHLTFDGKHSFCFNMDMVVLTADLL